MGESAPGRRRPGVQPRGTRRRRGWRAGRRDRPLDQGPHGDCFVSAAPADVVRPELAPTRDERPADAVHRRGCPQRRRAARAAHDGRRRYQARDVHRLPRRSPGAGDENQKPKPKPKPSRRQRRRRRRLIINRRAQARAIRSGG